MTKAIIHIVVNPVAGHGKAKDFVKIYVEPLLEESGHTVRKYETRGVKDAGRIAKEIAATGAGEREKQMVVIAGGDGTAHEFIEGVYRVRTEKESVGRWELAILPLGTANALYASLYPPGTPPPAIPDNLKHVIPTGQEQIWGDETLPNLYSFLALLSNKPPRSLPVSLLTLSSSDGTVTETIPSHVVISTSLHANLLATAEGLREQYPGLERFKVAAQQNAGVFHPARVRLFPPAGGSVGLFDPASGTFRPAKLGGGVDQDGVLIDDDFAYFLSTTTVPRLEPTFVISPLLDRIAPTSNTTDVVILRPSQDPLVKQILTQAGYDSLKSVRAAGDDMILRACQERWVPRAWEVLGKAYQEGAHVDLTYTPEGATETKGRGEHVVEVYRAGGLEWTPVVSYQLTDSKHPPSHVICADGSLHSIPPGGKASVAISHSDEKEDGIYVWA